MEDLCSDGRGPKWLFLRCFLFTIATLNQHSFVKAENAPMHCPDESVPPFDRAIFYCTNSECGKESFLKTMASRFYWSPDDQTKVVSITGQTLSNQKYFFVSLEELVLLKQRRFSFPTETLAIELVGQLESYATTNPEQCIFRNNSEKVLVCILDDIVLFNDMDRWINTMVESHSKYCVIVICGGSVFNESHPQVAYFVDHSYWFSPTSVITWGNMIKCNGNLTFWNDVSEAEEPLLRFVNNRTDIIQTIHRDLTIESKWVNLTGQTIIGPNDYDFNNIAIGNELDGLEDMQESASLPRMKNHNYWNISLFQELLEWVSNISWSICTRDLYPVPPISVFRETATTENFIQFFIYLALFPLYIHFQFTM